MRRKIVGIYCIAILSLGCNKHVKTTAASYTAGDLPVETYARHTGVWKVKAAIDDRDKLQTLPATERLVHQGDPIGFRTDQQSGRVVAYIGDNDVFLPDRPGLTRYAWTFDQKRRTQFGKEMNKARQSLGDTAKVAGVVAIYGGVLLLEAAANSHECHDPYHASHH